MNKLSIIIPAYNEEEGIREIIERTLSVSPKIQSNAGISDVEVIVVNDGSQDATARFAQEYSMQNRIRLISYEQNRGYGAAIKSGFAEASGELLSFLDADGTCDPLNFIDLIHKMKETDADIVIGGRLNRNSRMPLTRKLGNVFYRVLVHAISSKKVNDISSGMRIMKKESWKKLSPLPDGLHFTPAMSVRAILDRSIKIEEVPIPYEERVGRSKLSVIKDGFRFLGAILEISFTYKPLRLFGCIGIVLIFLALLYGIDPIVHYIRQRNVPEDRIYRLLFVLVAGISGVQMLFLGLMTQAITNLIHNYEMETAVERILDKTVLNRLTFLGILCILAAVLLNANAILQYVSLRKIFVHWSYIVTGGLLVLLGFQLLGFSIMNRIVDLLKEQKKGGL
ncbi:glycosyltransferase family 2 protein [bacterium]|nr:glycosyltransferase family 2 protein [bacterium]MCI0605101.1 glycosyltransferase family 2 protein [bacterium]